MERALVVSCNAYFAQLGLRLGAPALQETAPLFDISLGQPESTQQVRDTLPFAAYGQGQVLATPFKMARVAATIAGGGAMPQGRWVIDETNRRTDAPSPILAAAAGQDASRRIMRGVGRRGHGPEPAAIEPPIAGKTGTAEVQDAAVARLVRGVRALRRPAAPRGGIAAPAGIARPRRSRASASRCSWNTAATAARWRRPSPARSSRPRRNCKIIQ